MARYVKKRGSQGGRFLLWGNLLFIASFLVFRVYVGFTLPPPPLSRAMLLQVQPEREAVHVPLKRGDFSVLFYIPAAAEFAARPKALILFGSGDGGYGGWEERVCKSLQADGYAMIGFDCARYAATDYDLATLQADMATIARKVGARFGDHPPPLILGGWSMGAVQAVAAGGGPNPPPGLAGLLVISPGSRGRYGLREADRWNITPTGSGTFALSDFAATLGHVRIAQWDGRLDLLGSSAWLDSLTAPHRAFSYTFGLHDYNGASDDFLLALRQSIEWILSP